MTTINLSDSFKAYDVRGIVGETITDETVQATAAAFVDVLGLAGSTVLVGGDMRPSSTQFMNVFAETLAERGANPVILGQISTDELYFASGTLDAAGVTFTASHNPAGYNGIKMPRAGAKPISADSGLEDIRILAQKYLEEGIPQPLNAPAEIEHRDVLPDYARHLRSLETFPASAHSRWLLMRATGWLASRPRRSWAMQSLKPCR